MKKKVSKNQSKEKLFNVPNFITSIRVILTFVLIYMLLGGFKVSTIFVVFIFAAFTDFIDGQAARRLNQVTRFGAKFDILADRFLWISCGLLIPITFYAREIFFNIHIILMLIILSREIICFPFILIAFIKNKKIMLEAEISGKVTTFLQGFAFPTIILSALNYIPLLFALILAIITGASGIWASSRYSTKLFIDNT